jgi:hypothetical protein
MFAIDETTFKPMIVPRIRVRFKVEAGKVTGMELIDGQTTTQLAKQP